MAKKGEPPIRFQIVPFAGRWAVVCMGSLLGWFASQADASAFVGRMSAGARVPFVTIVAGEQTRRPKS